MDRYIFAMSEGKSLTAIVRLLGVQLGLSRPSCPSVGPMCLARRFSGIGQGVRRLPIGVRCLLVRHYLKPYCVCTYGVACYLPRCLHLTFGHSVRVSAT